MTPEIFRELSHRLDEDRLTAVATVVAGGGRGRQALIVPAADGGGRPELSLGGLGSPELDAAVLAEAGELLASFQSRRLSLGSVGEALAGETVDVFVEVHPPRPQLVIVGAVHVAVALVSFAKALGFRTVVVDPRTAFATPERFAHADELSTEWPDAALRHLRITENTYVALLSHDFKLDVPALSVALPSPARYIGALGSKKTHHKRRAALEEAGIDTAGFERIHNPIGLDLGGRRAEEIAVAVLAEMIAVAHGRTP